MNEEKRARELAEEILQEFTSCYSKSDEDVLCDMIFKWYRSMLPTRKENEKEITKNGEGDI